MTDVANLTDLVQDEIRHAVDRYVATVVADQQWQTVMEQQITDFVKDRISAKFQNIESIPVITGMIKAHVAQMFAAGQIPGIQSFVDATHIKSTIDTAVQQLISSSLEHLVQDAEWVAKIQQHVEINLGTRISERLSELDVNSVIANEVAKNVGRWRAELARDFASTGIRDLATRTELVISDGAVVVQSGLACDTMLVEQDLTAKNLIVTGMINTDCASWNELADVVADKTQRLLGEQWQRQLVEQVLLLAREQGIDFHAVTINGTPLVQGSRLNASITETSIQKLGVLQELSVSGTSRLSHTLTADNKRVGINTDTPDMALTVWDEEVSVSIGKISQDRAWIGSGRNHALDIGTNRRRAITIEPDGLVVLDRLRIDRWRISFANSVPNHSGTRGDIVINHDPKPGAPFCWQCLGGFQWQSMHMK
jgi:hypothetical protein